VTRIFRYLPLLALSVCCIQLASAQSTFDFNVGLGAAQAKAASLGIDTSGATNLAACSRPVQGSYCEPTSSLSGVMIGIGGNLMLWKHFGVGVNANIQAAKSDYATLATVAQSTAAGYPGQSEKLQDRVTFWQFDATYMPYSTKKASFQVIGGVGGANTKFYDALTSTGSVLGNTNQSQAYQSANHFQVHAGVGFQYYISGNIFIRPEFDIHYVPNFIQFGSNVATSESVWIGYSFGNR
jgi:hypothetical protein